MMKAIAERILFGIIGAIICIAVAVVVLGTALVVGMLVLLLGASQDTAVLAACASLLFIILVAVCALPVAGKR